MLWQTNVIVGFMADIAVKATLVLLLAGLAAALLRHWSAARRHVIWAGGLCVLLALPAMTWLLPQWQVLPQWSVPEVVVSARVSATPALPATADAPAMAMASPAAPGDGLALPLATPAWWKTLEPADWMVIGWAAGAAVCLMPLLVGYLSLWRIRRVAVPAQAGDWPPAILAAQPLQVLISRRCHMPMTSGILRRQVILPQEAADWPASRLKSVLQHELAHVRRRDCLWQALGQLARAIHWFNPLAWMAYRHMLSQSERACDDAVIATGSLASDYAEHLLSVATAGRSDTFLAAAAIAMARPRSLEGRLLAVLDATRSRKGVTALSAIAVVAILLALAVPVAMLRAQGPAAAGRLDFRAAVAVGEGELCVSDQQAQTLTAELAQDGPSALARRQGNFQWFAADDSVARNPRQLAITGQWQGRLYVLASTDSRHVMLADEAGHRAWGLVRAYSTSGPTNEPSVGFEFDQAGAKRFAAFTGDHLQRVILALVDDQVATAATVQAVIGSAGVIASQGMSEKQAADLAARLQHGMPPVSSPASQPARSGWDGFGPAVERVVTATLGKAQASQLRLSDGQLIAPPPEAANWTRPEQWTQWVQSERIDLQAANDDTFQGLLGYDMAVGPLGRTLPAGVNWAQSLRDMAPLMKPGTPALLSAAGTLPVHYAFRTRDGSMGVLSILGLVDNPRGVKLRYRLLQQRVLVAAGPTTTPSPEPSPSSAMTLSPPLRKPPSEETRSIGISGSRMPVGRFIPTKDAIALTLSMKNNPASAKVVEIAENATPPIAWEIPADLAGRITYQAIIVAPCDRPDLANVSPRRIWEMMNQPDRSAWSVMNLPGDTRLATYGQTWPDDAHVVQWKAAQPLKTGYYVLWVFAYEGKFVQGQGRQAAALASAVLKVGNPPAPPQVEVDVSKLTPAEMTPKMKLWVEDFFAGNYRDITARRTIAWGEPLRQPDGNWSIAYKYEATIWNKDKVTQNKLFTFTPLGGFVSVKNVADESSAPATQPSP